MCRNVSEWNYTGYSGWYFKKTFRYQLLKWVRIEDAQGPYALRHTGSNKEWSPEDKLTLVSKVIAGESNKSVALNAGINDGILYP